MKADFLIDHLDTLAQGVSKIGDKVTFIPKTLPGETGEMKVVKESKGVRFARLLTRTNSSPLRVKSPCPHFEDCMGCHYLHVRYEEELHFKTAALFKQFSKVPYEGFCCVMTSPQRYGYRNRIQLHYDRRAKKLGFMDQGHIIAIPHCLLPLPQVKQKLDDLYRNDQWLKELPPNAPSKGHLEIYLRPSGEILCNFNNRYAAEGFEQVNPLLNKEIAPLVLEKVLTHFPKNRHETLFTLDLFGGEGNLSKLLPGKREVIDSVTSHTTLDLYNEEALFSALKQLPPVDCLIVNPPRSGFKLLGKTLELLKPSLLIYMSCDPATLARDLTLSPKLRRLKELYLIDFFPGTYHFETLVIV